MSKRKRATGRFLRIGEEIFTSAAWRTLPDSAVRLWLDLRTKNNGFNNGKITPTISTMRELGWTSKSKLARALALLVAHGFVAYTKKCGPNVFHRASRIRFTDIPMPGDEREGIDGCGPTWDFLKWTAPKSGTRAPFFAVPARRGGTAPGEGEQPPPEKGNESAEPPRQKGTAEKSNFHRENGGQDDTSRRSPSGGDFIELAIHTGDSSAPEHDAPLILRTTDLKRQAAQRRAAKGKA